MPREESLSQIERIASSQALRGSESLCKLLRYLARQALDNPGAPIREYQIATQVFGRPTEFDPRLDSTVRVQTGRLRSKLSEYYGNSGASDPVVVEIPKGAYHLSFQARQTESPGPSERLPGGAVDDSVARSRRQLGWVLAFAGMTGVALILAFFLFAVSRGRDNAAPDPEDSLRSFWAGPLSSPSRPLVVFAAGVGETLAVHELDTVFALFQRAIPVRPIAMLSPADRETHDLIFVGPPPDNAGLRGFRFQAAASGPEKGEMEIVNLFPLPGEAERWTPGPSPAGDYGVIALGPGTAANRWILVLAGTTPVGTQAAVDFVCRDGTVRGLVEKTGRSRFEALIHTRIQDGGPADTQLIAVHPADR